MWDDHLRYQTIITFPSSSSSPSISPSIWRALIAGRPLSAASLGAHATVRKRTLHRTDAGLSGGGGEEEVRPSKPFPSFFIFSIFPSPHVDGAGSYGARVQPARTKWYCFVCCFVTKQDESIHLFCRFHFIGILMFRARFHFDWDSCLARGFVYLADRWMLPPCPLPSYVARLRSTKYNFS